MSFTVTLYNFSKQENSTKRPSTGTDYNCVLKDGSSIINPILRFNFGLSFNPSQYNYSYISIYSRYYFISEWTFEKGIWIASLDIDVLASWKDEIGLSSLYVLRSASTSNDNIVDNMYTTKSDVTINYNNFPNIWYNDDLTSGFYVVGIINGETGGVGSVTYYTLNWVQMKTLNNFLMGDYTWLDIDITDMVEGIQKILFNPYQYIVSCFWFPFAQLETATTLVKYGWWDTTSSGTLMTDFVYNNNFTIDIPKHPQITSRGEFLQSYPYSEYYLVFYPFGIVKIDSSEIYDKEYINIRVNVDLITGVGRLVVYANDIVINSVNAQVGIPVQLSQVTTDYIGMAQSVLSGAQSIATGSLIGGVTGGIVGSVSAIGNVLESIAPKLQTSGSGGGFSSLLQAFTNNQITLFGKFVSLVDEDNIHRGRPLCEVRIVNTLSGYLLIADGDVATTGTREEDISIKNYLESGFYYE